MPCQDSCDGGMLIKLVFYVPLHNNMGFPSCPKKFGGGKLSVFLIINVPSNNPLRMYLFKDMTDTDRSHLPGISLAVSAMLPFVKVIGNEVTEF
jgi:hypothetical protein